MGSKKIYQILIRLCGKKCDHINRFIINSIYSLLLGSCEIQPTAEIIFRFELVPIFAEKYVQTFTHYIFSRVIFRLPICNLDDCQIS